MGIFDSLKNMTNQAVKNNVTKAVSGAVNNARYKSKTFVFADYPKNADELKKMPELDFFVTSFNSGICNACVA